MVFSERLRDAATSTADDLIAQEEVDAVLLVGSVATGHADEYSDVDLRVVGADEAGERFVGEIHVEWTPTTRAEIAEQLDGWDDDSALYTYANAELLYDQADVAGLLAEYEEYPPDVRTEKLFVGWYYGTGETVDAQKAVKRGDDRVVRCATRSAVEQFVALSYVLEGRFPPYRKWLFRDPSMEFSAVDAALDGDADALDELASNIEPELRGVLNDDRIDRPYLHEPTYDRLG